MKLEPAYPNPEHKAKAEANTGPFISDDRIDAVLLVNCCAHGNAALGSCLDIVTLARRQAGVYSKNPRGYTSTPGSCDIT